MRTLLTGILFVLLMASPSYAKNVYCVNCSDKFQQAIEKATGLNQLKELASQVQEAVVQTEQQITMVAQNIERYENMIMNTINLPMDIYHQLEGQYQRLASLYQDMTSIRGDLDGIRRAYKDLYPRAGNLMQDFSENFDNWSEQADKSTQAVAELSAIQLEDLVGSTASEKATQVRSLLSSPTGRMQAIQAGNQLTAMQLQEAQELRMLLATAVQEQAVVNAKQEKISQAEQEHMRQVFRPEGYTPLDPRKATNGPLH